MMLGAVAALSFLAFLILVAIQSRKRKLINRILQEKNQKITSQYEEIQTQSEEILQKNAEIEAQRDFAEEQRDMIVAQNKKITDSIHSAYRIQNAMLSADEEFDDVFNEHFIFYLPKDIVSGDFYWLKKVRDHIVLAAADSTGHGVPGAFMSMLGMAFLTDIVNNRKVTSSGEVLTRMRDRVKQSLNQRGKRSFSREGMDMALIAVSDQGRLQFSGAYNGIVIVRNKQLFEFKGDRMPIGTHFKEKAFTTHEFQLLAGDCIYLFSDGFIDQFGGQEGRKYLYHNFKQFLVQISDLPMQQQQQKVQNEFERWKSTRVQIDDLLVIGVRW